MHASSVVWVLVVDGFVVDVSFRDSRAGPVDPQFNTLTPKVKDYTERMLLIPSGYKTRKDLDAFDGYTRDDVIDEFKNNHGVYSHTIADTAYYGWLKLNDPKFKRKFPNSTAHSRGIDWLNFAGIVDEGTSTNLKDFAQSKNNSMKALRDTLSEVPKSFPINSNGLKSCLESKFTNPGD